MLGKNKIIVSEVNRYTKPVVARLLVKYNKVTHPDFDQELREVTGIGWKQIRNYRNHPNQSSSISENSKIKTFILENRKTDKLYKAKVLCINIIVFILAGLLIMTLYKGLSSNTYQEENLNTLVKKSLEDLLGNRDLKGCKRIDHKTIKCADGLYKAEEINE